MKSRARVRRLLVLGLLCFARASAVPSDETIELEGKSLTYDDELSKSAAGSNEIDGGIYGARPTADKLSRDKRALGLLLSGLAQIFGYTVTPIQLASLQNPTNATTMPGTAPAASANSTAPRTRQETIRFTGVVNFGNNSDILGHLQRYEQIFHGRSNATNATTPAAPASTPKPSANLSIDPRSRPPLLAPFFVKIPLPIAPNLPPATMPIEEFKLSYPADPLITVAREEDSLTFSSVEDAKPPPVRQEEETVYRKNEDTERYTVEEKDIYDEKEVTKPMSKYTHQLYVADGEKQRDDGYDRLRHEQEEENVAKSKAREEQRHRDKDDYYKEDELDERNRNREEEIADRNRGYQVSKYESTKESGPAYDEDDDDDDDNDEVGNENSAGKYEEERANDRTGLSGKSSKVEEENGGESAEGHSNYDHDEPDERSGEQERPSPDRPPPANFNKYVEVAYNQQLPIGDYFHESYPEEIRDSYGELLDGKKTEDDRLSDYFSMFKHPGAYDFQRIQGPEDNTESRENEDDGTTSTGYERHLDGIQKLREEYASSPAPESKYEEYDIHDENEANGGDDRSRASAKRKRPDDSTAPRLRGATETTSKDGGGGGQSRRKDGARSEKIAAAKPRQEIDLAITYTPLIVPVRYVDASVDRVVSAAATRLPTKYDESDDGSRSGLPIPNEEGSPNAVASTAPRERLTPPIGPPERPRQLHEGEREEHHRVWPPPFDYAFDNTVRTDAILPANLQSYPLNYYRHAVTTNVAASDANNDGPSAQPSGYVVVVGNPVHSYRYPYKVHYFSGEAINNPPNQQGPDPSAQGAHPRVQVYALRPNADRQQFVHQQQANPNPAEYNRTNETTGASHNYYRLPPREAAPPADVLDRYGYIFGERVAQTGVASSNRDARAELSEGQRRYARRTPRRRVRKSSGSEEDRGLRSVDEGTDTSKAFDDPRSAHDFFGTSKNDYGLDGESGGGGGGETSKVTAKRNGETAKETRVLVAP